MTKFDIVIAGMAIGRILIGLAPFIAAKQLSTAFGVPSEQDTPSGRLMARFSGVRDIGLGWLVLHSFGDVALLRWVFLFNAVTDGGDLLSISIPLIRRQGIDRTAVIAGVFAVAGGLSWMTAWWLYPL